MSDNLPLEIEENIIKRLSLKPLIQCRSVSKTWKSIIDSSRFISEYNARNKHHLQHHLLVRYDPNYNISERTYVSIVDDDNNDTLPNQRIPVTEPPLVNNFDWAAIIGTSHGLLCLYGIYRDGGGDVTTMAVIWNVSIRKAIAVVLPNVADEKYKTLESFGACRETNDPKIVKIRQIKNWKDTKSVTRIPHQVEVFTLSAGAWRSPCSTSNLLRKSIELGCRQGVEGFCYWLATDRSVADRELDSYNLIVSFDMTSEEFTEISLPDDLVYDRSHCTLFISNLRESLVVLDCDESEWVYNVWRMEDGVPKSFTKLFTICVPDATILGVLEFRKSGEPIIEISEHDRDPCDASVSVVVYEPNSKRIRSFVFDGLGSFFVYPYKETLLLLDQPDFTVYDNGKSYIAKNGSLLKHTCDA